MIERGHVGVDYSFSRPNPAELARQGVKFACRYLSPDSRKNASADEVAQLHAVGIGVILNWEWYAGRPNEGTPAGTSDATAAVAQAAALGYPPGSTIIYSVDYDVPAAGYQNAIAYLQAAEARTRLAGYRAGMYGKYALIDRCASAGICTGMYWQPFAWAPNGPGDQGKAQHPAAHAFQRLGLKDLIGINGIDENVALKPFDVWLPGNAPTQGVLVADFLCSIDGNTYAVSPGGVMPVTQTMLQAYSTTPNIGAVDGDPNTRDRILFFLTHGRWQLANTDDPGPREARGLAAPSPTQRYNITLSGVATP